MISRLVLNLRSASTEFHPGPSGPNVHKSTPDQSLVKRTIGNLAEDIFVSGYPTAVAKDPEDKLEAGIPLVNVSRRSEFSGNI